MLRQMLYLNMESLPTLQEKITLLLSIIQNKDLSRLNLYIKQTQAMPIMTTQFAPNTNPSHVCQNNNFHPTPQQNQTSPQNQDTSFFRQAQNPAYHETGSLHKYYSQGTLDTALPDESLYNSMVNSQQSEELQNFMQLSRRRKMEAKEKRVSNLIESGKISQQLKLLKMSKKLSQYQSLTKPMALKSVRQIDAKLSSERAQGLNRNYAQTDGGRKGNPMNISLRQRFNNQQTMNFDGHQQGKQELRDQFSFRQGLHSGDDENMPTLPKTYSEKQFQMHQNGTFDDLEHNLSMTPKTNFNHGYQAYQDNYKPRQNFCPKQNDQSYENNLRKLNKLKQQKFEKQKNETISTKNLDQRIDSMFNNNDRQRNNPRNNKFSQEKIETDPNYKCSSRRENTQTNRSIFYTQSEDASMNSQEEDYSHNDKQNINCSKEKMRSSRSPRDEHGYFKKKPYENPSFSTIPTKPNDSKVSNTHLSNKPNKSHSKSSLSRSLSNKSKKKLSNQYQKQAVNKQKQLRKQRIPFEKKFVWMRQDGDLGDFELDPTQFSPQVKEYFIKRRKVIPSLISSISYKKDQSNQTQLVNRKKLQKTKQKEVQQKLTHKSNSLQLLRMKLNELDF